MDRSDLDYDELWRQLRWRFWREAVWAIGLIFLVTGGSFFYLLDRARSVAEEKVEDRAERYVQSKEFVGNLSDEVLRGLPEVNLLYATAESLGTVADSLSTTLEALDRGLYTVGESSFSIVGQDSRIRIEHGIISPRQGRQVQFDASFEEPPVVFFTLGVPNPTGPFVYDPGFEVSNVTREGFSIRKKGFGRYAWLAVGK